MSASASFMINTIQDRVHQVKTDFEEFAYGVRAKATFSQTPLTWSNLVRRFLGRFQKKTHKATGLHERGVF